MTSLPKQWQNSDLRETKQIIYHSKGIDESYPKMCFLLNLSHCVKSYRHFCSILALFKKPAHQIWSCHVIQDANFKKFLFCPNSKFNVRKTHKISSGKALYVRSYQQKTSRGRQWKTPPTSDCCHYQATDWTSNVKIKWPCYYPLSHRIHSTCCLHHHVPSWIGKSLPFMISYLSGLSSPLSVASVDTLVDFWGMANIFFRYNFYDTLAPNIKAPYSWISLIFCLYVQLRFVLKHSWKLDKSKIGSISKYIDLTPFWPVFLPFKGPSVFKEPPPLMISGTTQGSPVKLCTFLYHFRPTRIQKEFSKIWPMAS